MKSLLHVLFTFLLLAIPVLSQRDVNSVSDKLFDLRMQHKYDEAIAELNKLIEINPNDPKLYVKRAEFWKLQNKLSEAFADLEKAIDLAPTDAISYLERAKYFNLAKNNEGVLKDVRTAISLAPDKQIILIYATKELTLSGQYEENIKIADSYIARNELSYWAYEIRSENKFALKNYAGALEDSIKSIELISFTDNKDMSPMRAEIELANLPQLNVILPVTGKYLKEDKRIFDYYKQNRVNQSFFTRLISYEP